MNSAKNERVRQAMSAGATDIPPVETTAEPTQEKPKKRSPVPSPEFVEARCRRDLRVLHEREVKLDATHAAKKNGIAEERAKLNAELAAVKERLGKGDAK